VTADTRIDDAAVSGTVMSEVARPENRDPHRFAPAFVAAPARSHSSVIVTMLGQHPQLHSFPELILFRGERVGDLLEMAARDTLMPLKVKMAGLLRALAEEHEGKQSEESVARALVWLQMRADWPVADVFDHLLECAAPETGVEKSPENTGRDDYLDRMNTAYPRARYLHLVRHPAASVKSMYQAWWPTNRWNVQAELFHQFCLGIWYHQHSRILRFANNLPESRYMRVRSEDIVNNPQETLPSVCRWLGIDDSQAAVGAMCHPEESAYARRGPGSAPCGNDPKFLDSPTLRPSPIPVELPLPAEWVIDPWNHLRILELAQQFGY
jgi:hypothetical protein